MLILAKDRNGRTIDAAKAAQAAQQGIITAIVKDGTIVTTIQSLSPQYDPRSGIADQERGSTCAADATGWNVGGNWAIQILEYFDRIGFTSTSWE
ncbi:hypothetical protein KCP76_08760 [Salmonella enterica subsp. enterica serovar Weltevreden]|nr:hypothetical protein KCP76_08760 [Salmonella enterica subsp. enterica serovar Weltevreden]